MARTTVVAASLAVALAIVPAAEAFSAVHPRAIAWRQNLACSANGGPTREWKAGGGLHVAGALVRSPRQQLYRQSRFPALLAAKDQKGEEAARAQQKAEEAAQLLRQREAEKFILFGWLDLRVLVLVALV